MTPHVGSAQTIQMIHATTPGKNTRTFRKHHEHNDSPTITPNH